MRKQEKLYCAVGQTWLLKGLWEAFRGAGSCVCKSSHNQRIRVPFNLPQTSLCSYGLNAYQTQALGLEPLSVHQWKKGCLSLYVIPYFLQRKHAQIGVSQSAASHNCTVFPRLSIIALCSSPSGFPSTSSTRFHLLDIWNMVHILLTLFSCALFLVLLSLVQAWWLCPSTLFGCLAMFTHSCTRWSFGTFNSSCSPSCIGASFCFWEVSYQPYFNDVIHINLAHCGSRFDCVISACLFDFSRSPPRVLMMICVAEYYSCFDFFWQHMCTAHGSARG